MSDLVKRLRTHLNDYSAAVEAADRIEALEAALNRAERALTRAGWTYMDGAEEWKPPLGPSAAPLLDRIEALEAALREILEGHPDAFALARAALAPEQAEPPTRITGASDIVDEAACLIWSELCPDTVMGDEDRPYYEAAAKAVIALLIEECAKVCEGLRHEDYPSETSEWSSGTFDCAQAVRALGTGK